ncbi:unnamed protein product [Oppiella nova]|uniref:Uncharacterized protein n=1 Tax=Oppiella nova TaxID=334625 RepID=A0A7R9MAD5_9ACAR|nr:unnamed protein product [Oppiella nova]CAG2172449.1 unnamed protein product [Oppiella nova]
MAYIIYTCGTGGAPVLNGILSWKGWQPISKLTFQAYLVHITVHNYMFYTTRQTVYITVGTALLEYTIGFESKLIATAKRNRDLKNQRDKQFWQILNYYTPQPGLNN